jgi:nicotinamide mononucleotide adenylyltransferase
MYKHVVDHDYVLRNLYIDGVFTLSGEFDVAATLKILSECDKKDTMVVLNPNEGKTWLRMEDLMRTTEGLILMRGSFNPMHSGHISMIEATQKHYPNYKAVYLISLHNRDKADVNISEAVTRALNILALGYTVIFSSLPYFSDSSMTIRKRWKHPVIYPVGIDTINRFIDDIIKTELKLRHGRVITSEDYDYEHKISLCMSQNPFTLGSDIWDDVKFLVFKRKGHEVNKKSKYFKKIIDFEKTYKDTGISSTKIRNGEWNN